MNSLDIFFVVVLGFFVFRGIFRGLILEISSIAGLIAGFMMANRYYMDLEPVASRVISTVEWAQVAAYLGIFITTMFVVAILSMALKRFLQMIMLGWLDRIGGGCLGLVKAGLVCTLTLMLLTIFLPKDDQLLASSDIAPYIQTLSKTLSEHLPEELKQKFRVKAQDAASILDRPQR
ncbi:MAG: CvpA family protein [Desulfonatronovibrio sp. MSAO_Bac4]|nr:MAG: CvpA family protein [Desulfonatronovibrio sp. MSAO_Bac4]